jgi:alpha-N-arabinofuranosidase
MKRLTLLPLLGTLALLSLASAQDGTNNVTLDVSKAKYKISRNIYGHFSEHLGRCIYGGFWVGENSKIPNVRGIRTDVVHAMKEIRAPFLRWPGGCFADEYHWKNGIGPRASRPSMVNTNWGGVTEDNSFGTHEFLDLCRQIGCEPYFSANLGSGTVQEMSQWVEYVNSDNISPITELRKQNGRDSSWGVTYWGLGNESWGCGGSMKPQYYADLALRYGSFMKNYGTHRIKKIAVGPGDDNYDWTNVVMREMGNSIWGLSLHYYTWCNDIHATDVTEKNWYSTMQKTLRMKDIVERNSQIMDQYDPGKSVALVVDEWGTWYEVEPGTNPAFLYQQNTLRDALVAGINLNIFNNHCNRVKMAAVAQAVNVLQSVILTKDDKIVLTPTYRVFDMYKVHQDAVLIPTTLQTDSIGIQGGTIPALNVSSSLDKDGKIHVTICNLSTTKDEVLTCDVNSFAIRSVSGQIVTADKLNADNTFDNPNNVVIEPFNDFKSSDHSIRVTVPKHSVLALEVQGTTEIATPKLNPATLKPGLSFNYYEGAWQRLPVFSEMKPVKSGTVRGFDFPEGIADLNYGLQYDGYIRIESDGLYEFFLTSDDGSRLTIDDDEVILNDGRHAMVEESGTLFLTKGYHAIKVDFFQAGGGAGLRLAMQGPGKATIAVSDNLLYHTEK